MATQKKSSKKNSTTKLKPIMFRPDKELSEKLRAEADLKYEGNVSQAMRTRLRNSYGI